MLLWTLVGCRIVILAAISGGAGATERCHAPPRAAADGHGDLAGRHARGKLAGSRPGFVSTPAELCSEPGLSSRRMTRNDRSQPPESQPDPDQRPPDTEAQLDQALEETFPASDPVAAEMPGR